MRRSCTAVLLGVIAALAGCTGDVTDAADDPAAAAREAGAAGGVADSPGGDSGLDPADPDGADAGATEAPDPDATTDGEDVETTASREIPPTFPPEVVLPAEHVVNVATESVTGDSRSFVLQLRTPGDPAAVFEQLTTRFVEGGWEELQQGTSNFGDAFTSSATYSNGTILVNLGVIADEQPGAAAVSYSVVPAGPVSTDSE